MYMNKNNSNLLSCYIIAKVVGAVVTGLSHFFYRKYFMIRGAWYYTYCDNPLSDEPNKTCRDVGSKRRYDDKCKNDPVWQTYNRAYKAHYARYMKKKMTIAQFEEWSRFASEIRYRALAGEIPFEQYYADIRR